MALDMHQRAPGPGTPGIPPGTPPGPGASGPGAPGPNAPVRSVRSGASGPGALHARDSWQSSILGARIVIAAIVVLGQLWALTVATVALDGSLGGKRLHVWLFVAFEALSFAAAFGLWTSARRDSMTPERG